MTCPFVVGTYMLSCGASRVTYVPSSFELNEYCSDNKYERYRLCGYYRHVVWSGLKTVTPPDHLERSTE